MTLQTRTTALESVNTILSTIGEAPISSLTGTLPVDAVMALSVLNEINREVQSQAWHFNTHHKAVLSLDTNNKIPLAINTLRVELNPYKYSRADYDIVQRGNFLYNLSTNSDIFASTIAEATVVYLLPYDDIPEQAKRYITIRASRVFHDRTLGATSLHKFALEDELKSLVVLRQAESATGEHSIFDSPEQAYTVTRTTGNWWY